MRGDSFRPFSRAGGQPPGACCGAGVVERMRKYITIPNSTVPQRVDANGVPASPTVGPAPTQVRHQPSTLSGVQAASFAMRARIRLRCEGMAVQTALCVCPPAWHLQDWQA